MSSEQGSGPRGPGGSTRPNTPAASTVNPATSTTNPATSTRERGLGAKAGEAASKLTEAAQQAGMQAKSAATSLGSQANETAKGLVNRQVDVGADLVSHVAEAARSAAQSLDQNAPQIAGLVRGVADRIEDFSQTVRGQTVDELFETASDFARRKPAVVFGAAAACGFLLFRLFKAESGRNGRQDFGGEHRMRARPREGEEWRAQQFGDARQHSGTQWQGVENKAGQFHGP